MTSVQPLAAVVIPAHDEELVLGRCLSALLAGAGPGELEVVVVANGCSDATAEVARSFGGPVRVLEQDVGDKSRALNAGDAAVTAFPRFYLDADVELGLPDLRETVRAMRATGAPVAAPRLEWSREGMSWLVVGYMRVWEVLPYATDALVGVGVYALSEQGRAHFETFPDLIADDLFVRNLFPRRQRLSVQSAAFRIHPPTTLRGLLAAQTRARMGNLQLQVAQAARPGGQRVLRALLTRAAPLACRPRLWPYLPLHAVVYLEARRRGARQQRRGDRTWLRDESSRSSQDRDVA